MPVHTHSHLHVVVHHLHQRVIKSNHILECSPQRVWVSIPVEPDQEGRLMGYST